MRRRRGSSSSNSTRRRRWIARIAVQTRTFYIRIPVHFRLIAELGSSHARTRRMLSRPGVPEGRGRVKKHRPVQPTVSGQSVRRVIWHGLGAGLGKGVWPVNQRFGEEGTGSLWSSAREGEARRRGAKAALSRRNDSGRGGMGLPEASLTMGPGDVGPELKRAIVLSGSRRSGARTRGALAQRQ